MHEGVASSYFDNKATRALLGLEDPGAYGGKEPGGEAISLTLVKRRKEDRLFGAIHDKGQA